MSKYNVGDYVLIRGKVTVVDTIYDQIRVDLGGVHDFAFAIESIVGKLDLKPLPPAPPEPTSDVLVEDRDGDLWIRKNGDWVVYTQRKNDAALGMSWGQLNVAYAPLTVWTRS